MTYRGHIENGTVVLDDPVVLVEGSEVEIVVQAPKHAARTLHERLQAHIGMANGLPSDGSANLDHYLYGAPKK